MLPTNENVESALVLLVPPRASKASARTPATTSALTVERSTGVVVEFFATAILSARR